MQRQQCAATVAAVAGLLATCGTVRADADRSGYSEEGAKHISYVRSRPLNAAAKATMITDKEYAAALGFTSVGREGAIDVVMQQCFGGGFLNDIAAGGIGVPARRTFASAAAYDEAALNQDTVSKPQRAGQPAVNPILNNFTRAYVEGQRFAPGGGMRPWYNLAKNGAATNNGNVLVAKNPFSTTGATAERNKEHAQYWSPDQSPNTGPDRPNDFRNLIHAGGPDGTPRQYAVLVSWDREDRRHDLNIQRIHSNLRSLSNVPADNIAVLVGNRVNGPELPAIAALGPIDAGGLAAVAVDGPNSRNAFSDALLGDYFKVNGVRNTAVPQGQDQNRPQPGDKIFIYNTGHGGHATIENGLAREGAVCRQFVPTRPVNGDGEVISDGVINLNVRRGYANDVMYDNSFVDDSGLVRVQVTTDGPIDPAIFMTLNGSNPLGGTTPLFTSLLVTPNEILDITPLLEAAGAGSVSNQHTYQAFVPFELLENAQETGIPIAFENVFSDVAQRSILAVTFASGDQEYSHVFVPEPGGLILLSLGAALCGRRRRGVAKDAVRRTVTAGPIASRHPEVPQERA